MAIGKKTGGGSRKGIPNKSTQEVREAIATFASANIDKMDQWLNEIESPEKRLDLFLRALEYHVPKLGRVEHTGENGGPVKFQRIERIIVNPKDSNR